MVDVPAAARDGGATLDAYDLRWFELVGVPDPLAPFAGQTPPDVEAFAVLEVRRGGVRGEDHPLRVALARLGAPVARFAPNEDASSLEPLFTWRSSDAGRILAAQRLGPILEVYRIPDLDVLEGAGD